jgi:cytochrome c2
MNSTIAGAALIAATMLGSAALAQDDDLVAGENLYRSQCMVCHGKVTAPPTGELGPAQRGAVRLAMQQEAAVRDAPGQITLESGRPGEAAGNAVQLAVAPPYGPNLRGIYGRAAGTFPNFVYSAAFLKALKGMEWSDAALDVWITNPQKWVPGVYMFYKQQDLEIRRKIILYLKANP